MRDSMWPRQSPTLASLASISSDAVAVLSAMI
jgi:hypothetical protein